MSLRRIHRYCIPGFDVTDTKEWLDKGFIEIFIKDGREVKQCSRCCHELDAAKVSEHKVKVRTMDIHGFKGYYIFKRTKHRCGNCKN